MLAKQVLPAGVTPPVHFALVIFGDRVLQTFYLDWFWTDSPDLSLPSSQDYSCEPSAHRSFYFVDIEFFEV
jgi:hypothetical protein